MVRTKTGKRGLRRYLRGGWREETLPVNVFLVEHRAGFLLFDAGQTALATEPGYFPWWYPFFRLARFELGPEDEAAAQMRRLGLSPPDLRWIVLSHLHTDHAGGLHRLLGPPVVVSAVEWARATGFEGGLRGYLPRYWPASLEPRLVEFADGPVGPFPASSRLSEDGALVLVPTPGHTSGHMSLLAVEDEARVLFIGDMAETADGLDRAAPAVAAFCRTEQVTVLAAHASLAPELARRLAR